MSGRVRLKERFNLVVYRSHPHTHKWLTKHNSRHFAEKTVGAITTLVIRDSINCKADNPVSRQDHIVKVSNSHKSK